MSRVLLTGIGSGLGQALAAACLDRGDDVLALSRRLPEEWADHERVRFERVDLSRPDDIRPAIEALLADGSAPDLVILNAGVLGETKDLRDSSMEEIDAVMNVNVWANKRLFDALLDLDAAPRQLVAISSGAAFLGSGGWGAYCVSKSALNLLFRVYAKEHPDVHITCLAPGLVWTPMLATALRREDPEIPDDPRYEAIGRLREAKGTDAMQTPAGAAARILELLPRVLDLESGAYADIREL